MTKLVVSLPAGTLYFSRRGRLSPPNLPRSVPDWPSRAEDTSLRPPVPGHAEPRLSPAAPCRRPARSAQYRAGMSGQAAPHAVLAQPGLPDRHPPRLADAGPFDVIDDNRGDHADVTDDHRIGVVHQLAAPHELLASVRRDAGPTVEHLTAMRRPAEAGMQDRLQLPRRPTGKQPGPTPHRIQKVLYITHHPILPHPPPHPRPLSEALSTLIQHSHTPPCAL